MGDAKRRKAEIEIVKSLESRSLTKRYAADSPKSVDLSQGFVTFENLPWLPPNSLQPGGIPLPHPRLKVGIHNSLFVDEPASESTTTFFRSLERFCNDSGWTMHGNPLFWRYITDIIRIFATRSESQESLLRALGIGSGRIYNVSHITSVYDFFIRNHTKMGDHAVPLIQRLIAWLDFDPVSAKELIQEVIAYGRRSTLSLEDKFRLNNELDECQRPIGTHPEAQQQFLRLSAEAASGGKNILTLLFDSSEMSVKSPGFYLAISDYAILRCKFNKRVPLPADNANYEILKDNLKSNYDAFLQKQRSYDKSFSAASTPLTVYKGCVLLKKELVRAAAGGRHTPAFFTLGSTHRSRLGPCFTLSPLVAEWFALKTAANLPDYLMEFANHYPLLESLAKEPLRPTVIKYEVPKGAVLGFQALRAEAEVVISDIEQLKVIHYDFVFPEGAAQDAIRNFSRPHDLYRQRLMNPTKSYSKKAGLTWSPYLNKSNTFVDLTFDVVDLPPPALHKTLIK
jgi:hypothetical protein